MKKRIALLLATAFVIIQATVVSNTNYSEHVAPILYDKCTPCHHPGGIAPFSLMTYGEAMNNSLAIESSILAGIMPPWPPDTAYNRFAHERLLSQTEINTIVDWVQCGTPEGDPGLAPTPPTYNASGPQLGTPDLTISAPVYASNAITQDDYVCFSIPTGLLQDNWIQAVEVEPGNPSIVHHCLVFIDDPGTGGTDTIGGDCVGPTTTTAKLIGEFTPGSAPSVFPAGSAVKMGVELPANANVVLAMHYPEGSFGQLDSTKVHFYFHPQGTTGIREISVASLIENWIFWLPANQHTAVTDVYPDQGTTGVDYSLISVFPHMHLLGDSIRSYAVNAQNDTTNLVQINEWDFHWQGFYTFKNPVKLEAGSYLKGEGSYNNTTTNDHNPNDPPQAVTAGLNTNDEMFLIYFGFLPYEPGDEFLDLDELTTTSAWEIQERSLSEQKVLAYPNPFNNEVAFMYELEEGAEVELVVYDLSGQQVNQLLNASQAPGVQRINWNGTDYSGKQLPNGMYLYQLRIGNAFHAGRVVLSR